MYTYVFVYTRMFQTIYHSLYLSIYLPTVSIYLCLVEGQAGTATYAQQAAIPLAFMEVPVAYIMTPPPTQQLPNKEL